MEIMSKNKRMAFLVILSIIIFMASGFMVMESAAYYVNYYGFGAWQPLYLAALLEGFLISTAIIKVGKWWFKALANIIMTGLFCVIIAAASMNSISPSIETIDNNAKKEVLFNIIQNEHETLTKESDVLMNGSTYSMNQAASRRTKNIDDLKNILKQEEKVKDNTKIAILNVWLFIIIRFLIQLGNLYCAKVFGIVYRTKPEQDIPIVSVIDTDNMVITPKDVVLSYYPDAVCTKIGHGYMIKFGDNVINSVSTSRQAWAEAEKYIKENE